MDRVLRDFRRGLARWYGPLPSAGEAATLGDFQKRPWYMVFGVAFVVVLLVARSPVR